MNERMGGNGDVLLATGIHDASFIGEYKLGEYRAQLLGEIRADSEITYVWALRISGPAEDRTRLLATAEKSDRAIAVLRELGFADADTDPEVFLCLFSPDGSHSNFGSDEDWSDAGTFLRGALGLAIEVLELSDNDPPIWVRGPRVRCGD